MVKQQEKVTFEEFISQVFNSIRPRLLDLVKIELERSLVLLRDKLIGNRKYERGSGQKRWGYRTRKYLRTPLGRLEHVRVPRIRDMLKEVQLFLDRYTHYCKDVVDQLILAQVFNMSGRKVSLLFEQQSKDIITYPTITRLTSRVKREVEKLKDAPIVDRYDALIVDGIYGNFRGVGKGVILVALGVRPSGDIHLLDWLGARSESTAEWIRLFLSLRSRGLKDVSLVVGDGTIGLPDAIGEVFGDTPLQICLWHLCQDLMRNVRGMSYRDRQRLYHDFWKVFNAYDIDESYERYGKFLRKWKHPEVHRILSRYEDNLFHFYSFPHAWRHRLRTTNMAEGFFRHLRTFLSRYPGWVNEEQIDQILGLFLKGIKIYRERYHNKLKTGRYLVNYA